MRNRMLHITRGYPRLTVSLFTQNFWRWLDDGFVDVLRHVSGVAADVDDRLVVVGVVGENEVDEVRLLIPDQVLDVADFGLGVVPRKADMEVAQSSVIDEFF